MNEDEDIANEDFWKKSGDDYFQQEQYEKAIECYKEAIEINPNYRAAWNNLGFSYFKLGKLDEAKKCKEKINELKKAETIIQQKQTQPSQQIQPLTPPAVPKSKPADLPTSYQANYLLIALFIAGIVCIFIPLIGFLFVITIVIASAYFVYKDAESIGAGRSPDSWSPVTFGLLVLLFWLIALPAYILMRKSIYEEGETFSRGETVTKSKTSGLFTVLIILGAIVIFIILAAVIAAFVFGMAGSVSSSGTQSSPQDYSSGLVTPTVIPQRTSTHPRWGDLEVQDWGWTTEAYGIRYLTGTVKNLGSRKYSYAQIEFNVYDDSGAQIGSTFDNINNLEPYGTWKFKALVFEDEATKAVLKGITAF